MQNSQMPFQAVIMNNSPIFVKYSQWSGALTYIHTYLYYGHWPQYPTI